MSRPNRAASKRKPVRFNYQRPLHRRESKKQVFLRFLRKFMNDFTGGVFRGFGVAIGFTLLGAIIIYLLQLIVQWNLPFIGEVLGKIIKLAEYYSNGKLVLQ